MESVVSDHCADHQPDRWRSNGYRGHRARRGATTGRSTGAGDRDAQRCRRSRAGSRRRDRRTRGGRDRVACAVHHPGSAGVHRVGDGGGALDRDRAATRCAFRYGGRVHARCRRDVGHVRHQSRSAMGHRQPLRHRNHAARSIGDDQFHPNRATRALAAAAAALPTKTIVQRVRSHDVLRAGVVHRQLRARAVDAATIVRLFGRRDVDAPDYPAIRLRVRRVGCGAPSLHPQRQEAADLRQWHTHRRLGLHGDRSHHSLDVAHRGRLGRHRIRQRLRAHRHLRARRRHRRHGRHRHHHRRAQHVESDRLRRGHHDHVSGHRRQLFGVDDGMGVRRGAVHRTVGRPDRRAATTAAPSRCRMWSPEPDHCLSN